MVSKLLTGVAVFALALAACSGEQAESVDEPVDAAPLAEAESAVSELSSECPLIGAPDEAEEEKTEDEIAEACAKYDYEPVVLTAPEAPVRVLVFEKVTGYRHEEAQPVGRKMFEEIAQENGWSVVVSQDGGAFQSETLKNFDLVVFNNVAGDVFTLSQRKAFEDWMQTGGGYLGVHGAGGDLHYRWKWYVQKIIGVQFIGHTAEPKYQATTMTLENSLSQLNEELPAQWTVSDELYSFDANPRNGGATIIATVDESEYDPTVNERYPHFRMGDDHPMVWTQCVGNGRAFYSALGHHPDSFIDPNNRQLLANGMKWAAGVGSSQCVDGVEQASD